MQEHEAELKATVDLSPVSPSPIHASTRVVTALQDTVDTLDAMVAAAAPPNGVTGPPETPVIAQVDGDNDNDVVDDENFDKADRNEPAGGPAASDAPKREQPDVDDDYAKAFDSPLDPKDGDGDGGDVGDGEKQGASQVAGQTNGISLLPAQVTAQPSTTPSVTSGPVPETELTSVDVPAAQPDASSAIAANAALPLTDTQQDSAPSTAVQAPVEPVSTQPDTDGQAVDIQQLMADLTSQQAMSTANLEAPASAVTAVSVGPDSAAASALTPSSTLPPRPPVPQIPQSYGIQKHPLPFVANGATPLLGHSPSVAAGAPGTTGDTASSLPPPPGSSINAPSLLPASNAPHFAAQAPGYNDEQTGNDSYQRAWDQFVSDEQQYMSEAKWDRFPDGSRIFIGNLSSDKVTKRDVFDMFHRFGRLAQISLKSAFGFVQYHTVDEGSAAIENLQDSEIKGRRIHLEISRAQDRKKDRGNRSPDRARGRDGGRRGDKFQTRDDYRPSRNDYNSRDNGYGRDRGGYYDSERSSRGRSRSPAYGRDDKEPYRRRSPSPYGRFKHEGELDLPRRYGAAVPDVQIIAEPGIHPQFLTWVEAAFKARALKTEVLHLHPRIPKDQVIARQAAEGVHAVVDLDKRSQDISKVPVQAFDRSGGSNNVRFDKFVDLDPTTAAEVIVRAKASGESPMANYGQAMYGQPYGAPAAYANAYGSHSQHAPPSAIHNAPPPGAYPPQQGQPSVTDLMSLVGQVDNAALQQLLASVQAPQQQHGIPPAHVPGPPPYQQYDIQAILGNLGGVPQQHGPPPPQYGVPFDGAPHDAGGQVPAQNGDSAAQVQNIMSQLARYRQ